MGGRTGTLYGLWYLSSLTRDQIFSPWNVALEAWNPKCSTKEVLARWILFRTVPVGDKDHCQGILQWGRDIGLNSEYGTGQWGFRGMEQDGGQWMENY